MTATWTENALCASYNFTGTNDPWHPNGNTPDYREGKSWCARCPVRQACLEAAMKREGQTSERRGLLGGLTPEERRNLARRNDRPVRPSGRQMGSAMTADELATCRRMHGQGSLDSEISLAVGISTNGVADWRQREKLPRNLRPISNPEMRLKFRDLYDRGWRDNAIARLTGATPKQVWYWRNQAKLPVNTERSVAS